MPAEIACVSFEYLSDMTITYRFPFIVRGQGQKMSIRTNLSKMIAGRNCRSRIHLAICHSVHMCCRYWQLCICHSPCKTRRTLFAWSRTFGVEQGGPSLQNGVSATEIPECLRYKDLNSSVDKCHSNDSSVFVQCVLGIWDANALCGLSTVGIGFLMLQNFCAGRCCYLL